MPPLSLTCTLLYGRVLIGFRDCRCLPADFQVMPVCPVRSAEREVLMGVQTIRS